MHLSKIHVKNYRLLIDAELRVDRKSTLIVGRNNSAKTSLMRFVEQVLDKGSSANGKLKYDDYPLMHRGQVLDLLSSFLKKEKSYDDFCNGIPITSIEFEVDYSEEDSNADLGSLRPFIIDVDPNITTALIWGKYDITLSEEKIWEKFSACIDSTNGNIDEEGLRAVLPKVFSELFNLNIYAINPCDHEDMQLRTAKDLKELFPLEVISAERVLGEDSRQKYDSLKSLINLFFDKNENGFPPQSEEKIEQLRKEISDANKILQDASDGVLSELVNDTICFGYPNVEEPQLAVLTQLDINDHIGSKSSLGYSDGDMEDILPGSHNGLGYKNLIKIEISLKLFALQIGKNDGACVPLLFIEEPESHMHPQLQQAFAKFLDDYLDKIFGVNVQVVLTSHSSHIANTTDFSKIRYAKRTYNGVHFKDLNNFAQENAANIEFIRKYLTISRCDLFFADKAIIVEGISERILIPDMISKCDDRGLFGSTEYKLPNQYYTLIEVGGAYAHIFAPLVEFLEIPCLIITDIDPVGEDSKKASFEDAVTTSNATIKWWAKKAGIANDGHLDIQEIRGAGAESKSIGNFHIEFQTEEDGLCGPSLEEAIRNVNRGIFNLDESCDETDLTFKGKKSEFAFRLLLKHPDYIVPQYISDGLVWLNCQSN